MTTSSLHGRRALARLAFVLPLAAALMALLMLALPADAREARETQPDRAAAPEPGRHSAAGGDRGPGRRDDRGNDRGSDRGNDRGGDRGNDRGRGHDHNDRHDRQGPRWWDGAHGHSHYYPTPGRAVRVLPPHSRVVIWGGVNYGFYDGIWYAPGAHGYVVARPPFGIVVADLPLFRTLVTIGGLSYFYANGVYYRELRQGGYEVVPTPVDGNAPASSGSDKLFVYPKQGQSAQQQAADEYECHSWAASQTGFDPTATAIGQPGGDPARRGDYQRARSACLEGRGYTVR